MPKKPTEMAIALQYDGHGAPRVTATGQKELAQQILELANQHQIPLYHDPVLAEVLSSLELNERIPPELYRIIAEILAFAYTLSGKHKDFMDQPSRSKSTNRPSTQA